MLSLLSWTRMMKYQPCKLLEAIEDLKGSKPLEDDTKKWQREELERNWILSDIVE